MQSFSFIDMWASMGVLAKAVVIALTVMSIYSLGIMTERTVVFMRARAQSLRFVQTLGPLLKAHDIESALQLSQTRPQPPVARVVEAALKEYSDGVEALTRRGLTDLNDIDVVETIDRTVERTKEREIAALRRGLSALATIASAAPFVGLFGTVVGIINAFHSMAATGQGGLGAVSGGISEALVTTAFGLLVAIPALMVYNHLTNRVDAFSVDINDVTTELVNYVIKEGRPS